MMDLATLVRDRWTAESLAKRIVASLCEAQPERVAWEALNEREKSAWLYAAGRLISLQVDALALVFEDYDFVLRDRPEAGVVDNPHVKPEGSRADGDVDLRPESPDEFDLGQAARERLYERLTEGPVPNPAELARVIDILR